MAADEQDAQQPSTGIAGQIEKGAREAGEALVKELAKDIAAEPAGDPEVMVAFALGWQMSELYRPGAERAAPKPEEDLPGLGHLGSKERAQLGLDQMEVGLAKLEHTIKAAGVDAPSLTEATAVLEEGAEKYRQAIFKLHVALLATLTAAHFKLGKAYGLGRALADTTRVPHDLATLKAELEPHRLANLIAWLADLTSLLPPHAGHVVHTRLEAWRDWAAKESPSDPDSKAVRLLRREGERWRSLLSGEKNATDALKLEEYVHAGELALSHTSTLALRFLERFKLGAIIAVTLFIAGLGLVIWDPTGGSIAGGIAGIAASLGLTWKGVGASLGHAAAKIERPVWEGALDTQIAASISLLPGSAAAADYVPPAAAPEAQPSTA